MIDVECIRSAHVRLVDLLGGASVYYWEPINAIHVSISRWSTPRWILLSFMMVDHDGKTG